MTLSGLPREASHPASILVVDDDRRVVELLTIALTAYGFRVLQAGDGEEALRAASRDRPDLVVLDVRLPKRSGLEVCEMLRKDPDDPQVPIILVSAAAETEARLQGLARGADDFVAKPFSPKELIARIRRLLARSAESRAAHRRSREAEHELSQAREEARRSHDELREQQRLRELTHAFMNQFHHQTDGEHLMGRLLLEAQAHLGSTWVALLCAGDDGVLRTCSSRGDDFERAGALQLKPGGELGALLAGLGRPVRHRELQRFPALRDELMPFVVAGTVAFAPLRGLDGLEAILVAGERHDGHDLARQDLDVIAVLSETAALALRGARRSADQTEGALDALEAMAARDLDAIGNQARIEAAELAALALRDWPHPWREQVARAIRLGEWAQGESGGRALSSMAAHDPSGRTARLATLLERAARPASAAGDDEEREAEAARLVAFGLGYASQRARGETRDAAIAAALSSMGDALPSLRETWIERIRSSAAPTAATASRSR